MTLWLADEKLVLASKSQARRAMLKAAGLPFDVVVAEIDERATERSAVARNPMDVASLLARAKATAVSKQMRERIVIGADQTLALGQRRFTKPMDRASARQQLQALRGKTHLLCSAVAVVRGGKVLFEHCDAARLTMRDFTDEFLEAYLSQTGSAATESVGGYQLEKKGVQLFSRIDGDHFTILGLPLLALLRGLRELGFLAS